MRSNLSRISLLVAMVGAACDRTPEPRMPLTGEWDISFLQSVGRDGVFVFDRRVSCYCLDTTEVPSNAMIGRAYLDLETIGRSPRRTTDQNFAVGPDADYYEEVTGFMEGQDVVIASRGPTGPRFTGTLEGESVRGTWVFLSHEYTLRTGEFLMNRVRSTAYTDSARVRSRRGVQAWMNEPPILPTAPVDTAPPVTKLPPR
jgi:hypothetical protein